MKCWRSLGMVARRYPDHAVIGLVMLACFAAFLGAGRVSRFLGVTGRAVSTRMPIDM